MPCGEAKLPGSQGSGPPQRGQHVAVQVAHGDLRRPRLARSGASAMVRLPACPGQLADVDVAVGVDQQVGRRVTFVQMPCSASLEVEDLDAIVLAVAHEDAPVGVRPRRRAAG